MINFDFCVVDMPKGLIGIQISSDETVIFTFSSAETIAKELLFWLCEIESLDNNLLEFHINQEKETFDIVLPLQKFAI